MLPEVRGFPSYPGYFVVSRRFVNFPL